MPRQLVLASLTAVLAAAAVTFGPGAGVAAAAPGESVPSFDAQIDVDGPGDLRVTETIAYDFGDAQRHGLRRELRTRSDGATEWISDVTVSSPSGAPVPVESTRSGATTSVRIGDPAQTVTGRQTYVLRYVVHGAFDGPQGGSDELAWDVTGSAWDVPIDRVTVRVRAPRPATAARCRQGAEPCTATAGVDSTFSGGGLAPGRGLSVELDYPAGTVLPAAGARARPAVAEPGPVGRALGFVMLLVVLAGLAFLGRWVWSELRDTAPPAGPPDAPAPAPARRVRPRVVPDGPSPPTDLRPGQLAMLVAGRADTDAVVGTVLDLARRGFLGIEEQRGTGRRHGPTAWTLVWPAEQPDERPLPYENAVLASVLGTADRVSLADARTALARDRRRLQTRMLTDATERGWFQDDGSSVLHRLVRLVGGRPVLTRSAAGEAVLLGTDGFRAELADVPAEPIARADDVPSRSLAYAVALGLAPAWVAFFDVPRRPASARRGGWSASSGTGFDSSSSSSSSFSSFDSGSSSSSSGGSGGGSW